MDERLELISFEMCPYVQRSVIALKYKKKDFDIKFIDLQNKPDWFLKISPLGKVPVLRVGDEVLFESAIINEYIDDVTSPHLQSPDPLVRAKEKGWIEVSSQLFRNMYLILNTKDQDILEENVQLLFDGLEKVEGELPENAMFFRGDHFSLVDCAFAPLFWRMYHIEDLKGDRRWEKIPKVRRWADNLVIMPAVKESVVEGFAEKFKKYLKSKGGIIVESA